MIEQKYQKENFFNLNDIAKYIEFRKISYGEIDDISIIFALIFVYRFSEPEIISDLKQKLQIQSIKIRPSLDYENSEESSTILIDKIDEKIKIKIKIKAFFKDKLSYEEKNNLQKKFNSLNSTQKICILFLILCVLSKRTSLIQGETASGKSHVIRTFGELMGKKINIYKINSESSTILLAGQSHLNSNITKEESEELKIIFQKLEKFELIKENIIQKFEEEKYNEWSSKSFKELINKIKKEEEVRIGDEKEILKECLIDIKKIIMPIYRFNNNYDSKFVISMKNGDWNLFDGIENSPPQLVEKIIILISKDPELDLLETGKNKYFFTKKEKKANSTKINDNFFIFIIFITYNISQNDIFRLRFIK